MYFIEFYDLWPLTIWTLKVISSSSLVYAHMSQVWSLSVQGLLCNRENSLFLMYFFKFYDLWPLTVTYIYTHTMYGPSLQLIHQKVYEISREWSISYVFYWILWLSTFGPKTNQLIATCIYKPSLKLIRQRVFELCENGLILMYFIEFYDLWPLTFGPQN